MTLVVEGPLNPTSARANTNIGKACTMSAIRMMPALTMRLTHGLRFPVTKDGKTKIVQQHLANLGLTNALIIDGAAVDANFAMAARNIPDIDVLPVQGINVYDILRRHTLVLTRAALTALEARFA